MTYMEGMVYKEVNKEADKEVNKEVDEYEAYAVNKVDKEVNKVVDEYEANAVDQELNDGLELEDVVMVMVVEVMKLTLVMEMVVDKDVDVKDDEDVDVEVDCEVFEEVAKYVYNALKKNSPHKDQLMRMLVFAKQRQLEAAKIILCASAHLPSSKTRVT